MSRCRRLLMIGLAVALTMAGVPAHACALDSSGALIDSAQAADSDTSQDHNCPFHAKAAADSAPQQSGDSEPDGVNCCPTGCTCSAPAPVPVTLLSSDASPDHSAVVSRLPILSVSSPVDPLLRPPQALS